LTFCLAQWRSRRSVMTPTFDEAWTKPLIDYTFEFLSYCLYNRSSFGLACLKRKIESQEFSVRRPPIPRCADAVPCASHPIVSFSGHALCLFSSNSIIPSLFFSNILRVCFASGTFLPRLTEFDNSTSCSLSVKWNATVQVYISESTGRNCTKCIQ
jgi:hypothetical protein